MVRGPKKFTATMRKRSTVVGILFMAMFMALLVPGQPKEAWANTSADNAHISFHSGFSGPCIGNHHHAAATSSSSITTHRTSLISHCVAHINEHGTTITHHSALYVSSTINVLNDDTDNDHDNN